MLDPDGERFIPGQMYGRIESEHHHRYCFASQFVSQKVILDIACGEGYGSEFLSRFAHHVTGVDISHSAVEHARQHYPADNLHFSVGSCADIPLEDNSVDVVVSFETIEHHTQHVEMFKEITRVLRPFGLLVISSPDKVEYSERPNYHNRFHVKELYKEEFSQLVSAHFQNVKMLGQKAVLGSVLFDEGEQQKFRWCDLATTSSVPGLKAEYWIALASNGTLPVVENSIFGRAASDDVESKQPSPSSPIAPLLRLVAVQNSRLLKECLHSEWYLRRYPDIAEAAVDPYEHWIAIGADEDRLPSADPVRLVDRLLQERSAFVLETGMQLEIGRLRREMVAQTEAHFRSVEDAARTRHVAANDNVNAFRDLIERNLRKSVEELAAHQTEQISGLAESLRQSVVAQSTALSNQLTLQQSAFDALLSAHSWETLEQEKRLRQELLSIREWSERTVSENQSLLRAHCTQVLSSVRKELEDTRASLAWRLSAPIRALVSLFGAPTKLPEIRDVDIESTPSVNPPADLPGQ